MNPAQPVKRPPARAVAADVECPGDVPIPRRSPCRIQIQAAEWIQSAVAIQRDPAGRAGCRPGDTRPRAGDIGQQARQNNGDQPWPERNALPFPHWYPAVRTCHYK